jgi:hypothetical protein
MFSLPQGELIAEGRSEDKPIVLSGDTPDEFRQFLWALINIAMFVHLSLHLTPHYMFKF